MRMIDPSGAWKVAPEEPRLLVRREPTEVDGTYYRVLPEGRILGYDGTLINVAAPREGLDLNRNFPGRWRPEAEQEGAGPYPASEPEVRNIVEWVTGHPNLMGGVAFHTSAGALLRPFSHQEDDAFAPEDLRTYTLIGKKGTELTGYPALSIHHDFRYHPKQVLSGELDSYLYEQLGLICWSVELWNAQQKAGIKEITFIEWDREHPLADDLALFRWNDEVLHGDGFVDWHPFEHPDLGPIELGGWDWMRVFVNPPAAFLEQELAPFPAWLVWQLLLSPRMEIYLAQAEQVGPDCYRVRLVVQNTGWLPSYVTKQALEQKTVRGVVCEIALPDGASLVSGKQREELGQLEGRAYTPSSALYAADATSNRLKVEWYIRSPLGGEVRLTAQHDRAGTVRTSIRLRD